MNRRADTRPTLTLPAGQCRRRQSWRTLYFQAADKKVGQHFVPTNRVKISAISHDFAVDVNYSGSSGYQGAAELRFKWFTNQSGLFFLQIGQQTERAFL